ncbi:MAG: N-acetylglucosamine kinase, partial [Vicinamibacterales bacterium]
MGIDAGGSKTVAYLAGGAGQIVGEGRAGGANLQAHGELEVEKALHHAIEQALGDRDVTIAAICLGIAGVDRPDEVHIVSSMLRRLGFKTRVLIVNDALIALVAATDEEPGIVVISGTGSIAYGLSSKGVAARAGGWGSVLGDEGSGYWMGRRALVAVMRAFDGRGPATELTQLMLEHFNVTRPDGLVREIYDRPVARRAIAATGLIVERARAAGDLVASEILADAASEIGESVRSVATRLGMRGEPFRTVLAGGMFKAIPWLVADVTRRLEEIVPRSTAILLEVEPAVGAVRLALRE